MEEGDDYLRFASRASRISAAVIRFGDASLRLKTERLAIELADNLL